MLSRMKITCAHCGRKSDKATGAVNRAKAAGLRLFCDRRCAGLAQRKQKTKAQMREEKRVYDKEYQRLNRKILKAKKAAWHLATYDPEAARIKRKKWMKYHVEYCRRPSYRRWKQEYDRRYEAGKYGQFADAYKLTLELNREIKSRSTNYEISQENQTFGKTQKRRCQG
jgi:hypothetical protein